MSGKPGVFFPYFGAKFMRSRAYPKPRHDLIIEPFAGAAGYSVRHALNRRALLIDASPYVAGVWRFLIAARESEIDALPTMRPGQHVDELHVCQEARWLIGFWINQGSGVPKKTMGGRASNRVFGTWGEASRARISDQLTFIRDWKIVEGDFSCAPDVVASWFIDPPYQKHPNHYGATLRVTYTHLADWCSNRTGQVIVCETQGADWLPFTPITTVAGASHRITIEQAWIGPDPRP